MKARLNNLRMSPRKVRLVADAIRGMPVAHAAEVLTFLPKAAARPLEKLLASALASANEGGVRDAAALRVADIRVDAGPTLKRSRPRARGSAARIRKRTSKVSLVLGGVQET